MIVGIIIIVCLDSGPLAFLCQVVQLRYRYRPRYDFFTPKYYLPSATGINNVREIYLQAMANAGSNGMADGDDALHKLCHVLTPLICDVRGLQRL